MSLRIKFVVYLLSLHVAIFTLLALTVPSFPWWFVAIEVGIVASGAYGISLMRRLVQPLEFARLGADSLKAGDFTTRILPVGQAEMDQLIQVYNSMLVSLRAEQSKLGEQRGFYDKLLDASPSGILIFDFDGRLSSLNPSALALFQLDQSVLLGKTMQEIEHPMAEALSTLEEEGSRLYSMPGGRQLRCQKSHFIDRGFSREFILLAEVTEELRQSERAAYEKLIRMMTHELNNTMGSTNSLLQSCSDNMTQVLDNNQKEFKAALELVISRNQHLGEFMERLAQTVRIPEPSLQAVDLAVLLENIRRLLSSECVRRNIEILWAKGDPVSKVRMDEHLMEQVFLNIVKNAMEAIDHDGTITISVTHQNGETDVSITDTGGKLTHEVQQNLFTPFFTTKRHGQGVGLVLVREILTKHGFSYSLSGTPGKETIFRIVIPDFDED